LPISLIATGLNYKKARVAWEEVFQELAIKPASIHTIIVTHFHPDHSGLAGFLQEKTGAEVWMSKTDRAMFELAFIRNKEQAVNVESLLQNHGTPRELIEAILENLENITAHVQPFADVSEIKENDFHFGNKKWEVYETPGHSQGHLCFYQKDEKILLSADMILDKITPNISIWPGGSEQPLDDYLSSLNRLKDLSADQVWPGHGDLVYDVEQRIDELLQHHEKRLNKIRDLVDGQTCFAITEAFFDGKDLTSHQWRFAIGETLAHLEHLANHDLIRKIEESPFRYRR